VAQLYIMMAEKLDRNWIGTDTTKKYIEIAKNKT
jgi:DNA modification methylase